MDNLRDLLSQKDFDEPPEISAVKRYVDLKFNSQVGVAVQPQAIVITASSSSLAGMLRLNSLKIQKAAATTKKIVIRTGKV